MKAAGILIAALLLASADEASGQEMTVEQRDNFNALADAVANVRSCRRSGQETCEWRGQAYSLGRGVTAYSGSIISPEGSGWLYGCRKDDIENDHVCHLEQNGFRLMSIDGEEWVGWGGESYPGSYKVVRLGDDEPIRWPESVTIDGQDAEMLVNLMGTSDVAKFRWFDWPANSPRDLTVDTRGMVDTIRLFRAIRSVHADRR